MILGIAAAYPSATHHVFLFLDMFLSIRYIAPQPDDHEANDSLIQVAVLHQHKPTVCKWISSNKKTTSSEIFPFSFKSLAALNTSIFPWDALLKSKSEGKFNSSMSSLYEDSNVCTLYIAAIEQT